MKKWKTKLRQQGWRVLRFWEHEVEEDLATVAKRISFLVKKSATPENHRQPNVESF
jgi:very-short-patch-repair endonuclease